MCHICSSVSELSIFSSFPYLHFSCLNLAIHLSMFVAYQSISRTDIAYFFLVIHLNILSFSHCFPRHFWSMQLVSVVIKRNKDTRQPEGFGFLNFADHATADQVLKSYNGQKMPNADRNFRLNWVIRDPPEKRADAPGKRADDNRAIYVGGLGHDVTDSMLHNVFKDRYPSVTSATVVRDGFVGQSKGYGFVEFADVNERREAMTEMNGAYCSTRPMRIGPATGMATNKMVCT